MSLNETFEVRMGKNFCDTFPIQNGMEWEVGDALPPLLFNFAYILGNC
jgi:hypothetical protein